MLVHFSVLLPWLLDVASAQSQRELQEMLKWAVNNSDPEKLRRVAEEYKEKNLTIRDTMGDAVIDKFMKDNEEPDYLSSALAVLQNEASLTEDIVEVLQIIQELMEDINVAFYAHKLGLLEALYKKVFDDRPQVSALAAWSLGSAMQNVPQVQNEFLSLDEGESLRKLIDHLKGLKEYSSRLLFALSSAVRGNGTTIAAADAHGLFAWAWRNLGDPEWPGVVKAMGMLFSVLSEVKTGWVDLISEDPLTPILEQARTARNMDVYEKVTALMRVLAPVAPARWATHWADTATKAIADCSEIWGAELCSNLLELRDAVATTHHGTEGTRQRNSTDTEAQKGADMPILELKPSATEL
eukprot:GEMP01046534.1.p1 GENE.GEMP01046534.1~~GEMP01046534.1.p1  ORF type:complete len:354 (+),score=96.28 GEMP01046534.1:126-1187(+)